MAGAGAGAGGGGVPDGGTGRLIRAPARRDMVQRLLATQATLARGLGGGGDSWKAGVVYSALQL